MNRSLFVQYLLFISSIFESADVSCSNMQSFVLYDTVEMGSTNSIQGSSYINTSNIWFIWKCNRTEKL